MYHEIIEALREGLKDGKCKEDSVHKIREFKKGGCVKSDKSQMLAHLQKGAESRVAKDKKPRK